MKKKVAVINLGCPKNQVDSEVISGLLADRFINTFNPEEANIIIVNTCGFIEEAKAESIEMICEMIQLKSVGKCEKVFVTGCLAQRYGEELLKEIPELDGVLGDGDLQRIPLEIENARHQRVHTFSKQQDFIYSHAMPRVRFGPSFSAYLKIAEGCDNRCSYCAIPMIKGKYRSRPIESILAEAKKLASEGVKEIILVAQDTTRFGIDLYGKFCLPGLLHELAQIEDIRWIRLMYCYPDVFSDELIEIIAKEPKICKYVDLPLQHADNKILAKMNRRNTAEEAEILINKLRTSIPGIFIRSTFITGFPGETEEQFAKMLQFIRQVPLDRLGVFAYSQEENTPAGMMEDQIPTEVREERKNVMMSLQAELASELQQRRIGQTLQVILEEEVAKNKWVGRSEGDAPEIDGQIYVTVQHEHSPGDILHVRILQVDSYDMQGEGLE
ncbi:MAG: 30S ribosomal protein S12 methylthiotransferase RimO [Peptococcaceae bacterium]|nr:30S ribosomal protein S12 methylthiotransferase RimO [Peptococcaceae bacterium]